MPKPNDSVYNERMKELQILILLEKRLDEICIKMLGNLPSMEPLFLGMPRQTIPTCTLSGKDRSLVKKEWDKYLKRLGAKRRMVKLSHLERHYLCEGKPYHDRFGIPGFTTIQDPFASRPAVLDIPCEIALRMIAPDYAPEI